jgi:hypothetical protein
MNRSSLRSNRLKFKTSEKKTPHFLGIYGIHLQLMKQSRKIITCNLLGWTWNEALAFWTIISPDTGRRPCKHFRIRQGWKNESSERSGAANVGRLVVKIQVHMHHTQVLNRHRATSRSDHGRWWGRSSGLWATVCSTSCLPSASAAPHPSTATLAPPTTCWPNAPTNSGLYIYLTCNARQGKAAPPLLPPPTTVMFWSWLYMLFMILCHSSLYSLIWDFFGILR